MAITLQKNCLQDKSMVNNILAILVFHAIIIWKTKFRTLASN